ncbi:MAG: hypothetical protein M3R67_13380, partial [Acidobacteriota bacterium]|nr:hypothetical protein [Acidobacteriota bacterium]
LKLRTSLAKLIEHVIELYSMVAVPHWQRGHSLECGGLAPLFAAENGGSSPTIREGVVATHQHRLEGPRPRRPP